MLGQSFGGFCAMTYLSFAPEGLREAFITGGLRRSGATPTRSTARPIARHGAQPAGTSSATRKTGRACAPFDGSTTEDLLLPTGDRLTARRFRQLGECSG